MATIHFLYRSTRPVGPLFVRFQFTYEGKNFIVDAKSQNFVEQSFWDWYYLETTNRKFETEEALNALKILKKKAAKCLMYSVEKHKLKLDLEVFKLKLQSYVNGAFKKLVPTNFNNQFLKQWLQSVVNEFENPAQNSTPADVPRDLLSFIDFYIENEDLNNTMKSKYSVLKSKLKKFQDYRRKPILLSDINNVFRKEFIYYFKEVEQYSDNTLFRDFGYINTLCIAAGKEGIELDKKQKDFKAPTVKKIIHEILSIEEILTIENLEGLSESLDNVRDLFLISIYTGQRISDFMNFNKNMIREENGRRLLEFEQSKTGELMSIPIIPKLQRILDKRGGEFPRKISDQKYNDYLKVVLQKAGFTNLVWGRKLVEISEGEWRKKDIELPRYEFFSSHAGRRTFASNAFGKMPISDIMYLTGHTVEKTFLTYVNKKKTDRAHEAAPKLEALYGSLEPQPVNQEELFKELQKLVKEKDVDLAGLLQTLKA